MSKHKWHKEIKAWADGAEIEVKFFDGTDWTSNWIKDDCPDWHEVDRQFRIKPQQQQSSCCKCQQTCSALKEPQYLFAYNVNGEIRFCEPLGIINVPSGKQSVHKVGKIKLEVDDE